MSCFVVYVLYSNSKTFTPIVLSQLSDIVIHPKEYCTDIENQVLEVGKRKVFMAVNAKIQNIVFGKIELDQGVNWTAARILFDRFLYDGPDDDHREGLPKGVVTFFTTDLKDNPLSYQLEWFQADWALLFKLPCWGPQIRLRWSNTKIFQRCFGQVPVNAYHMTQITNLRCCRYWYVYGYVSNTLIPFPKQFISFSDSNKKRKNDEVQQSSQTTYKFHSDLASGP